MIYVVIPVHNRKELTRDCLRSLYSQIFQDFCVIVVDDGSTDGTSEMIQSEFPEATLLNGEGNLWWAGSINKGIRYALNECQSGDHIVTLNDDLIVRSDYLGSLYRASRLHPNSIIGSVETTTDHPNRIKNGGINVDWGTAKVKVINSGKYLTEFPENYSIAVSRVTGRGTLFPIRVFQEVGLFDEIRIKQCADTELPLRANFQHGFNLLVCYSSIVMTRSGSKIDINNKQTYTYKDIKEYFFGIRSHFNIKNRYWIARSVAPNIIWFTRFLILEITRTIGHFIVRFRLRT